MSIFDLNYQSTPDATTTVGPQADGTYVYSPQASTIPQPVDTPAGAPANYSQQILDLFKFGVGTYAANQQSQQLFDYKKYEATNSGLYAQGQPAPIAKTATGSAMSPMIMLAIGAVVVFAVLTHKG